MADHSWPLRHRLSDGHLFITKSDLLEFLELAQVGDDEPVWIDNYWQPLRQIAQRPIGVIYHHADGVHPG